MNFLDLLNEPLPSNDMLESSDDYYNDDEIDEACRKEGCNREACNREGCSRENDGFSSILDDDDYDSDDYSGYDDYDSDDDYGCDDYSDCDDDYDMDEGCRREGCRKESDDYNSDEFDFSDYDMDEGCRKEGCRKESDDYDDEDDDEDEKEYDDFDDFTDSLTDLSDDELDELEQKLNDSDIDELSGANDEEDVRLSSDEERKADELMSVAATTELIKNEMNAEEKSDFVESSEYIQAAIEEGFLLESDIDMIESMVKPITEASWYATKQRIQLGKEARMKQLWALAVQVCARAHNDPDYKKLQKIYKLKRLYRARLEKKYNTEAKKRMKTYIARLKNSKSKPLNDIAKKTFK